MRERMDAFSSRRPRPIEISGKPSVMLLFFEPRLGVKYGSIGLPAAKATIEATLVSWQSSSPNRFSVLRNEFPPGGSATGESFPRSVDDANLGRGPDGLRGERRSFPGHRRASSRGSVSVKSAWDGALGPSSPVIARPAASRAACRSRFHRRGTDSQGLSLLYSVT